MPRPSHPETAAFVPSRRLPLLYLGFAHVSLLVATGVTVIDPAAVTGFYYHPWMIGVVHLVTLGWITASIELPTLVQFGAASLCTATSLHAVGTIRILQPGRHATYVESADAPLAR